MSLPLPSFEQQETPFWVLEFGILLSQENLPDLHTKEYSVYLQRALAQTKEYSSLPINKVRELLEDLLLQKNPGLGLQFLQESAFLKTWLPEVDALVNLAEESHQLHKDVWEHTKQVVVQAAPVPLIRWAALFHDIGKVPTRTINADGTVHFHRHAEIGAVMFQQIAKRLKFDEKQKEALTLLIDQHLRPNSYFSSWKDSAVRRFAKEASPYLTELLALSRADITSKIPGKKEQAFVRLDELAKRIQNIHQIDSKEPLLPKGFGQALMQAFSLPASPLIGKIKNQLETDIEAGILEAHQSMEYYLLAAKPFITEDK